MKLRTYYKFFLDVLLLFSVFSFLFATKIKAADFIVDYAVDYTVSDQGNTKVLQNISLINQQTNLYAREYSIIIDSAKIRNISASDRKGTIVPIVTTHDNKTEIRLSFNDEVVGQGKSLKFQLKYEDENIAKKNGLIWEINIPGIADDSNLGDYTASLHIPNSFGPAAYIVPEPEQQYRWSKKSLLNGGVNAAFGSQQIFDLSLSYYLENTKSVPIITEIALPPSTTYQFVTINSLDPRPETIVSDQDGNWLARYKLEALSTKSIHAGITVQLFLYPRSQKNDPIPDSSYVKGTPYWQVSNAEITTLGKTLKSPKEIYDYVVKTLTYDYTRINEPTARKGAVEALATPKNSVCMEFTDLFVAIARAAGIPARQAVGYAFTTNAKLRPLSLVSDVLHAWPEYYDAEKNIWIPIDPTWGSTTGGIDYFDKLDFNHIVFAYNGKKDDYPYPAGFYRKSGATGKDVEVRFLQSALIPETPNLTITFDFPQRIFAGLPSQGVAIIHNSGNTAAENTKIDLQSQDFGLGSHLLSPVIPPFGVVSIPFTAKTSNFFTSGPKIITASVNAKGREFSVFVIPSYFLLVPVFLTTACVITLGVYIRKRIRK